MAEVVTTTLTGGSDMAVAYTVDFGEIIIAGLVLLVASALALEFIFRLRYQQ